MNKMLILSLTLALPGAALAQENCDRQWNMAGMSRFASAGMEPPVLGATELLDGAQPATRDLVLARQTVTISPRIRYLSAPVTLTNAEGENMAAGVPLARGAPITAWRGREGVKHCAIGWRNGLFGGVTGDGHMRWVCLEDRDGDGAFDNGWRSYSRNLGLSFNRLDLPISPPVTLLDSPPEGAEVETDERTTVGNRAFERRLIVSRINADRIVIEARLAEDGRGRRIARQELPLDRPGQIMLSGITVNVTPTGRGAATVTASGDFTPDDIRLECDATRIAIGEFAMSTFFAFPNW